MCNSASYEVGGPGTVATPESDSYCCSYWVTKIVCKYVSLDGHPAVRRPADDCISLRTSAQVRVVAEIGLASRYFDRSDLCNIGGRENNITIAVVKSPRRPCPGDRHAGRNRQEHKTPCPLQKYTHCKHLSSIECHQTNTRDRRQIMAQPERKSMESILTNRWKATVRAEPNGLEDEQTVDAATLNDRNRSISRERWGILTPDRSRVEAKLQTIDTTHRTGRGTVR